MVEDAADVDMRCGLSPDTSAGRQGSAGGDPADDVGPGDDAGEGLAVHDGDALDLVRGHRGGDVLESVVAGDADGLLGHDVFDGLAGLADEVGFTHDAGELASPVEDWETANAVVEKEVGGLLDGEAGLGGNG